MSSARRRSPRIPVGGLVGVSALAIGFLAVAFSLPIDDFWLSLASGRAIFAGAPLDQALDFNWIPFVDGALNPQWGAQVVLALPGSVGGALLINAAMIAAGLLVTAERTARRAADPSIAAVAFFLALAAVAPHLLARAQSFSIAALPIALWLLERRATARWLPLAYGVLVIAWANLHGAFVIGQVAVVAYLVGAVLERRPWRTLALTALAAAAAPLVNPVGIDLLVYAYGQPAVDVVRQISVEWQPSYPWIALTWLFWLQAALVVALRIRRRVGSSVGEMLLAAALLVLAVMSIRHIPWFCLATAPMLASDLDALAGGRIRGWPRWLQGRNLVRVVAGATLVALVIQPLRPALPQGVGRVTPDAPVALVDTLASEVSGATEVNVLNEGTWGGYLAYRLADDALTAMDGRLEIRDRETWAAYFALMRGEGDPAGTLAAAGVPWALVTGERQALADRLLESGWRLVAEDGQGMLLADGSE